MATKVIIDTDIGYDPDDLFALCYLLKIGLTPELIVTGDECRGNLRARLTESVLQGLGRTDIPVLAGENSDSGDFVAASMVMSEYTRGSESYLDHVEHILSHTPFGERVLYICLQGAGNLSKVLEIPGAAEKLSVYMMGGAVSYTRPGRPGWVEHNVKIAPDAFSKLLQSPVDTHLVMAHTTQNPMYEVSYKGPLMDKLTEKGGVAARLLSEHFRLWVEAKSGKGITSSFMHDPLTVSVALGHDFVSFYKSPLCLIERSEVIVGFSGPFKFWSQPESQAESFMRHFQAVLLS